MQVFARVLPNNSLQRTALRAAADAGRSAHRRRMRQVAARLVASLQLRAEDAIA
jgi:hypothetical protein